MRDSRHWRHFSQSRRRGAGLFSGGKSAKHIREPPLPGPLTNAPPGLMLLYVSQPAAAGYYPSALRASGGGREIMVKTVLQRVGWRKPKGTVFTLRSHSVLARAECALPQPGGPDDNSPAFQRWGRDRSHKRESRIRDERSDQPDWRLRTERVSSVPGGLASFCH